MDGIRHIEWQTYGVTVLHPFAILLLLISVGMAAFGNRRQVVFAFLAVACLFPTAQRLVIATVDLPLIRLLLLAVWLRPSVRSAFKSIEFNSMDRAFLVWLFFRTLIHPIREGTLDALIFRLGGDFDALGSYFLMRSILRDLPSVLSALRCSIWIMFAVSICAGIEWFSGRNFFSVFGGVPEITKIREGRLRCQGAFPHPIIMGSFGASFLPIYIGMALSFRSGRSLSCMGAFAATLVGILSASSGPAIAILSAVLGWVLWFARHELAFVRLGVVALLVLLHFIREAPVWHLILRLGQIIGGTGYHRYRLIDAFIANFREWAFMGVSNTAHWGWGLQDTTNHFILEALRGGLVTLAAFVYFLVCAFRECGRTLWSLRAAGPSSDLFSIEYFVWGLGVAVAVNSVSFLSVAYVGQIEHVFYFQLAILSSMAWLMEQLLREQDAEAAH